jgi:RHS repeat-associated protein
MPYNGWLPGERYRLRLTNGLTDRFDRPIVFPDNSSSFEVYFEVPAPIPDPTAGLLGIPLRFRPVFDSLVAASTDFGGKLPGGQNLLFQGLWTDPVTGLSYARNRWYDARTASWLSEDSYGSIDSENLYAFVGWQPHIYSDPTGEYIESGWDIASLTMGGVSLNYNIKQGNWGSAAWDLFGMTVDTAAVLVPGLPGGAGAATKAVRAAQLVDQVGNAAQAFMGAQESFALGNNGWGAFNVAMGGLGIRQIGANPWKIVPSNRAGMGFGGAELRYTDDVAGIAPGWGGQKLFPRARQHVPWKGNIQQYKEGAATPLEHIRLRHWHDSIASLSKKNPLPASRFTKDIGVRQLRDMVDEAATYGTRSGNSIIHDFKRVVGTDPHGNPVSRLQVYLDTNGHVRTVFPVR